MTERRCTHCGGTDLARGLFAIGNGVVVDWFPATNAGSYFAKLKALLGPHFPVEAYRCQTCSHLDLFVPDAR
ncbi:hypothetical protein AB0L57_29365 [Nocardia sp. NPDC052254]|uniref:hypothetical protein n=1 Tax=Nocardia sp. NPDC052254 TaxID=3155681 RepID=UPI00344924B5